MLALNRLKSPFGESPWLTGRQPCHASGHLVIYCECYGFERVFFTLRCLLPYTPSCWFQGFPGRRQCNLKVSRFSCWSSKYSPGPTICLNHNNPQKRFSSWFYLRLMAGRVHNEESVSYGIWTLFKNREVGWMPCVLSVRTELHSCWWLKL